MKTRELNLLKKLESSWNDLSTDHIESFLADDVIYESQFVIKPLKGKTAVLNYLQRKFRTIRKKKGSNPGNPNADIGYLPLYNMRPCIVLSQTIADKKNQVTILIDVRESLISRIDICFIPDPCEVIFTSDFK